MKKLKALALIIVMLLVTLPFVTVSAETVSVNKTATKADVGADNTIKFTVDITSVAKGIIGEHGGKLSVTNVSFNADAGADVQRSVQIIPSSTLSGNESTIKVVVTFTIGDKEQLTSLKLTSITLDGVANTPSVTATATASPTATPDGNQTPDVSPSATASATASVSPSATASATATATSDNSASPTATPENTETPSPSASATPVVTKKPAMTVERTKDTYTRKPQTQAPPTLPPDVTLAPGDIATPVPEATPTPTPTEAPLTQRKGSVNGLLILFLVLILLLIIDIALILWRKHMGYENMINNGISRRKMRDDLIDVPEKAQLSDLEEALEESEESEETEE